MDRRIALIEEELKQQAARDAEIKRLQQQRAEKEANAAKHQAEHDAERKRAFEAHMQQLLEAQRGLSNDDESEEERKKRRHESSRSAASNPTKKSAADQRKLFTDTIKSHLEGRYEIGAYLGHGAFGVVFRAVRLVDKQPVAIKIVEGARLWAREQNNLLRVNHPHIANLLGSGEINTPRLTGGWLAFPLKEMDLLAFSNRTAGMPLNWRSDMARTILRQLLPAVRKIWEARLVHLDIAARNVLVEHADADTPSFFLHDFGVGKNLDETGIGEGLAKRDTMSLLRTVLVFYFQDPGLECEDMRTDEPRWLWDCFQLVSSLNEGVQVPVERILHMIDSKDDTPMPDVPRARREEVLRQGMEQWKAKLDEIVKAVRVFEKLKFGPFNKQRAQRFFKKPHELELDPVSKDFVALLNREQDQLTMTLVCMEIGEQLEPWVVFRGAFTRDYNYPRDDGVAYSLDAVLSNPSLVERGLTKA